MLKADSARPLLMSDIWLRHWAALGKTSCRFGSGFSPAGAFFGCRAYDLKGRRAGKRVHPNRQSRSCSRKRRQSELGTQRFAFFVGAPGRAILVPTAVESMPEMQTREYSTICGLQPPFQVGGSNSNGELDHWYRNRVLSEEGLGPLPLSLKRCRQPDHWVLQK